MMEHFALAFKHNTPTHYQSLMDIVTLSKQDLIKTGYDEIVIEDFYDSFYGAMDKLKELPGAFEEQTEVGDYSEFVSKHLFRVLCNQEEANYIIMYMRFLAASYLKTNAILFEDFLGVNINTFCQAEVE